MLDAGELPHRVRIIRDTIMHTHGAETRSPQVIATVWACVDFLSGNEAWKAQQVNATANVRVTMRYRNDLLNSDVMEYRDWRMEIREVIPEETTKTELVMMCEGKRIA